MHRTRFYYTLCTLFLLGIEIGIALFVDDTIIRPYVGDILVVILLYTFLRIFLPDSKKRLWLYIFLFAAGVEILQYFRIVDWLGLGQIQFFRVLIGSVFDWKDILCYFIGTMLIRILPMF